MASEDDKAKEIEGWKREFKDGEPVFVLRAADPFAVETIIAYARRCEKEGCDGEHVEAAFDLAMQSAEWQRAHPDRVKGIPG